MASGTLVSVVLPVFDGAQYIAQAVASILGQTHRTLELIVIDDGSRDATRTIVEDIARRDGRVRLVSRENRGLVATLNEGVTLASAELIARMDADDIAAPERLEIQVKYLEAHSECVAVGTRVLLIDSDGAPLMEMGDLMEHEEIDAAHLAGSASHLCHPSVLMRRSAVLLAGGYDDAYRSAEDLDLFLRLAELGRLANVPQPLLQYRQHLASIGYAKAKEQWSSARRAAERARARRGLPALAPSDFDAKQGVRRPADEHNKWAWWALLGGHPEVARKHAVRALAGRPFNAGNLKLMYCALRGH